MSKKTGLWQIATVPFQRYKNSTNIGFQKSELSDTSQNTPFAFSDCSAFVPVRQFWATFVTPPLIKHLTWVQDTVRVYGFFNST